MSIRIESLPLDHSGYFVTPPEADIFVLNSGDCSETVDPDLGGAIAEIYGGSSGSVAVMPQLPVGLPDDRPSNLQLTTSLTGNWSTSLQTMLDRPPPTLPNHLLVGGVLFCAAFTTWATIGQIDEVGKAQGRLVPQGEPYKVNPVVAGKIARVYVQESQTVKAGQVVATLDDEIARNRVEWSKQEHASYEKELLQIEALINKTRLEAQTRFAIFDAEIRAQTAQLAESQAKIESQKVAILQAEERAATGQLLLDQLQTDVAIHQERLARFEYLVNEGALAREQLFQAKQQFADRQRSITQQEGDFQQAMAESRRLRAELQQGYAEFKRIQADLARKYAEATNAQVQAQQSIQQLLIQKVQLQAKIQQNDKQLVQARAELDQLTLRAPANGVVSTLNVRKGGEVVQPGQTVAEIAPHGAPLILVAALPTREAGFVKVGDRAQIKFDAYPFQDYGIVSGKVTAISPDAKNDERLGAVYRVEIALDRSPLANNHPAVHLKAGQTATAEIVIRQKRIAEILLEPIRKLKEGGLSL